MHNPFPGMNPYLEQPGLWPQVHNRLIVAIADEITPQVAPQYRVSIEERIYTSTEAMPLIGIADVSFARRNDEDVRPAPTVQMVEPRRERAPLPVEVTERFLQVRLVQTVNLQRLVNEIYTRARFDLAIDYTQPLNRKLTNAEISWIASILEP